MRILLVSLEWDKRSKVKLTCLDFILCKKVDRVCVCLVGAGLEGEIVNGTPMLIIQKNFQNMSWSYCWNLVSEKYK